VYTLTSCTQLERFLRLMFAFDVRQKGITLDGNVREAIMNHTVTMPSKSIPPFTNSVRVTLHEMHLQRLILEVLTRSSNTPLHSFAT